MQGFFSQCKLQISGISYVLPAEVPGLLSRGAWMIDLRNEIEVMMKAIAVEKIMYLWYEELVNHYKDLPKDTPLILVDAVGLRSKDAVLFLREKGYRNVASLAGGIADWEKDGFPMKNDKNQQLNGPCLCMLRPPGKKE
jgi:rhodanese-related sulfurtransferase